jgi:hypothetical protein
MPAKMRQQNKEAVVNTACRQVPRHNHSKVVIKNKIESMKVIRQMNLNIFPDIYLNGFDEVKISKFLEETDAKHYVTRDKSVAMSPFVIHLKREEVMEFCRTCNMEKYTLTVSPFEDGSQVAVGEVVIHSDNRIDYLISHNSSYTPRELYRDPDFVSTTLEDVFDKRIKHIKGLGEIVDYIFENGLIGVIVEFSFFNKPVGIKGERIVIWELRTDY